MDTNPTTLISAEEWLDDSKCECFGCKQRVRRFRAIQLNTAKACAEIDFPYEYQGGGFWRKKDVPVGTKAETLHGSQVIEFIHNAILSLVKQLEEQGK